MKDDGGSIYAGLKTTVPMGGGVSQVTRMEPEGGLTIRDWFAGMALQGISAAPHNRFPTIKNPKDTAEMAYVLADAMLAARKEQQ